MDNIFFNDFTSNQNNNFTDYTKMFDAIDIGIWSYNIHQNKLYVSDKSKNMIGVYENFNIKNSIRLSDCIFNDDYDEICNFWDDFIKNGENKFLLHFRLVRLDKEIIWVECRGTVTERDEKGVPIDLWGTLHDISEIKKIEFTASQNIQKAEILVELTELGIWELDIATGKVEVSEAYAKTLGYYSKGDMKDVKYGWRNLVHPDDLLFAVSNMQDYFDGITDSYEVETRVKHKNGEYIWVRGVAKISERDKQGRPTRLLGTHVDIDRLKKTENMLKQALVALEKNNINLKHKVEESFNHAEQEELLRADLVDSNPQVNLVLDDKFNVINCNTAAIYFFGFTSKEELFENLKEITLNSVCKNFDGTDAPSIGERTRTAIEVGIVNFETEVIFKHISRSVSATTRRINYKDTFVVVSYIFDITQLRNAQKSIEYRDKLLSATRDVATNLLAIGSTNFYQSIWECLKIVGEATNVNRSHIWKNELKNGKLYCTQIYEWCQGVERLQGSEYTTSVSYDEDLPMWEVVLSDNNVINDFVRMLDSATRAKLEPKGLLSILVAPIYIYNEFWGFLCLDDCEKERKFSVLEENYLRSCGLLIGSAIERNEMNERLIKAKEEALSSAKAKSRFLANMSHEIRTPMNAILGLTTIARINKNIDRIPYYLQKIDGASRHLLGLLNDILDMSKIDASKLELSFSEVIISNVVSNICEMMEGKIKEKNINFKIELARDVPYSIISDGLRLSQILANLISNAIKFSKEQGEIILSIKKLNEEDGKIVLRFSIKDNGIGIEESRVSKLFRAFEQAEKDTTHKFGGTGLGLAISKSIVELMEGTIHLESKVGEGSEFYFIIPCELGSKINEIVQDIASYKTKKYDFSSFNALIVEDIEINREIVMSMLEDTGINVYYAENGIVAYEKMLTQDVKYDIIYMDMNMPEMGGIEVTKLIRKLGSDYSLRVPIVAMTANAFSEDIENCKKAGMNDHLAKPIEMQMLLEKTERYLRRK